MKEEYVHLLEELKAIIAQSAEHQKGLDTASAGWKALKKIQRNASHVMKEINYVVNDEECGYTVNPRGRVVLAWETDR